MGEKKQGVKIYLNSIVQEVEKDEMHIKVGDDTMSVKYGTLVWCAGIKPHPFVRNYGFMMNDRGTQILCDKYLRVKNEENVYAMGDCGTIEGYWLPQTAQVAKQQAVYLAKVLNQAPVGGYQDNPAKEFKFQSLGMMAYLGSSDAIMSQLPVIKHVTGLFAYIGWRSVYWSLQLSTRNRYMVLLDWFRTIVWGRDLTRFGQPSTPI